MFFSFSVFCVSTFFRPHSSFSYNAIFSNSLTILSSFFFNSSVPIAPGFMVVSVETYYLS